MAEKKAFEWASKEQIGTVGAGEKEKRVISLCSLVMEREDGDEERWYVSIETWKFFKKKTDAEAIWRVTKNNTVPLEIWDDINELVQEATE